MRGKIVLLALLVVLLTGCGSQPIAQQPAATSVAKSDLIWSAVDFNVGQASSVVLVDERTAWAAGTNVSLSPSTHNSSISGFAQRYEFVGGRWGWSADRYRYNNKDGIGGLFVNSDNDVWLTGSKIVHWDGQSWREYDLPPGVGGVGSIWVAPDGSEGWAGGGRSTREADGFCCTDSTVLLHLEAGRWVEDRSLTMSGVIKRLNVLAGEGFALVEEQSRNGEYLTPTILHLQGGVWSLLASPACPTAAPCKRNFDDIVAVGPDEGWLVGSVKPTLDSHSQAYIAHYKAGQWELVVPTGLPNDSQGRPPANFWLNAVSFSDRDHGLAVGFISYPPDSRGRYESGPLILRYSNGRWQTEELNGRYSYDTQAFDAVSNSDPSHALAVYSNYRLYSYGYGWQRNDPPTPTPGLPRILTAIASEPTASPTATSVASPPPPTASPLPSATPLPIPLGLPATGFGEVSQ